MSTPVVLRVEASKAPFCRSCVRCARSASVTYRLRADPRRVVLVPVCLRCSDRLFGERVAWVVASLAAAVAVTAFAAGAGDALLSVVPALRGSLATMLFVLGAMLVGLCVVPWFALRRGMAAYHARLGPVWVLDVEPGPSRVVEIGARSPIELDPACPRLPAGTIPPWGVALVGAIVGSAIASVGVVEFVVLGKAEIRGEQVTRHWLELVAYELGGRGGVLGLFLALGTVSLALGGAAARAVARARALRAEAA